jgi:hypothetical protein
MPYITREDGERFIIPSYRDTLSAKKKSLLKKEVVLLSSSYGEYITLQKKTASSYEIAISPDSGYLLGECVWHYFKRPYDMVYCEEIPNTGEAILVIVKSGSVYLDGSFSLDSIPEELVIFKTQSNNFSIFISGNVPISETPEDGKFCFDASSIRSFSVLDKPVFPTLPGIKAFQLQLVETVLRSHGIGVIPVKPIILALMGIAAVYFIVQFAATHKKTIQIVMVAPTNPYQAYNDALITPDPSRQITAITNTIGLFWSIPGWQPMSLDYTPGVIAKIRVKVTSSGARLSVLYNWAQHNNITVDLTSTGVFINYLTAVEKRSVPNTISSTQDVISAVLDRLSYVLPGNSVTYGVTADKKTYTETNIGIGFSDVSPATLDLIGKSISNLPLVLTKVSLSITDTGLSGIISLKALGN